MTSANPHGSQLVHSVDPVIVMSLIPLTPPVLPLHSTKCLAVGFCIWSYQLLNGVSLVSLMIIVLG